LRHDPRHGAAQDHRGDGEHTTRSAISGGWVAAPTTDTSRIAVSGARNAGETTADNIASYRFAI